jgi:hypothetical protein
MAVIINMRRLALALLFCTAQALNARRGVE